MISSSSPLSFDLTVSRYTETVCGLQTLLLFLVGAGWPSLPHNNLHPQPTAQTDTRLQRCSECRGGVYNWPQASSARLSVHTLLHLLWNS